ncbi:efflux RND transporter permease subunit [Methyloversatilis thermotolerans]|uniref:efflux RND transporter permease subunit n=1 Tax=Methyloversatilis thermotolerans TaxID=1346290 RepID=UPI0003763136|nr:efflux RND transporter permease subunit [Methyloversatilis thermotolerans]
MWFTRVSVDNPVFATMVMAALLVLGLFSYQRLSVEQFPNIEFPVVVVTTVYPGASPEVVETEVSRRIEQAVNAVSGLKTLTSRSYESQSLVIAEFDLFTDPAVAAADVREKVAGIRAQLRREVEEPVIARFNPDDYPVVTVAMESDQRSVRDLTTLANRVAVKRLETVRGVGRVTLTGARYREVLIHLRPDDMEALGVGVDQLLDAVKLENQDLPAGALTSPGNETTVKVSGKIRAVSGFRDIIVARRGGSPVYLWQVADVEDGDAEEDNAALLDGRRGLAIDIVKSQGANTLAVVDDVRDEVERLREVLPADVTLTVVRDTSEAIRNSVKNVRQTIIEGGVLTVLIVFFFLRSWRSTVITGLALPISLIGTFSIMLFAGFSLNTMTLMAMSLCVGLLIDDAIVVRENIVRHLAMGKSHRQAALEGTREIGLAVLATTFTLCAVFLPVAFMGGIIGRFFHSFGLVVVTSVLLSMLVSFTLDPMLSSVWHDPDVSGSGRRGPVRRMLDAFEAGFQRLATGYQRMVAWSLRWSKTVMLIALASLVGALALVPRVGTEFVPQADLSELLIHVHTAPGSSLQYTEAKVLQAEAALREDFPEVEFTYATINTGFAVGKNEGVLFVRLKPKSARERSMKALMHPMRERVSRIGGLVVTHVAPYSSVSSGKTLQVSIQGPDVAELSRLADRITGVLQAIPGTVDIDSSLKAGKPQLELKLDREAASELGVGVSQVAQALRPLIAGEEAGSWEAPDGEHYDIRLRLPGRERQVESDLEKLYLASSLRNADGSARMVALRQVADIRPSLGATQIDRREQSREVLISANVHGRPAGDVGRELDAAIGKMELPPGYRFSMGGSSKDIAETMGYAVQALMLSVLFIYFILASQFRSFTQPLAIMLSLPLSLIGVVLALMMAGSTLNIFSVIGFIMLMGLVTKNAILLVDFANQARAAGASRQDALLQAAAVRLRPILMTTAAMVFGMLPLALGLGEGAEQRAPMAHAVIGGVLASTLLTLLVVPVACGLIEDGAARVRRLRGHDRGQPSSAPR